MAKQRLTTLFLLHWYLASRSGCLDEDHGWTQFSYATRQSARMFCQRLVANPLPDGSVPSEWISDQPWYLFLWRHDPTIGSMLVVLDAIDRRFRACDPGVAWARLTDLEDPAIWFLLLPLSGLGPGTGEDMNPEDLYIKMNSRGKPLTEFETFKAHFEKTIDWSPVAADIAFKIDTAWSDLLWEMRGEDDLIDDEFMRFIAFVTEICEWRDERTSDAAQRLGPRAEVVFGSQNPARVNHLDFLVDALDVWQQHPIDETFTNLFAGAAGDEGELAGLRLFFRSDGDSPDAANLFEACCQLYGKTRGRTRVFSLGQSLMLYAVILHLVEGTPEFPRRARILRNLIEASADELRPVRMPKILADVHAVIRDGAVEEVVSLNQAQARDEELKADFLESYPGLQVAVFALEDHELLRGSIGAFELDPVAFESRADAFHRLMSDPALWPALLGSLLAAGEYQRHPTNSRSFLFGTDSKKHNNAWRDLLTGPTRDGLNQTRNVLATFLDRVAEGLADGPTRDPAVVLSAITDQYLAECATAMRFDWRYYMVRYPCMREKGSSTFFAERIDDSAPLTMGYSLCMLKAGNRVMRSNYRDPYLLAIGREVDDPEALEDAWFTGYEDAPRRLLLLRSGAGIRCVPAGFELSGPAVDEHVAAFDLACTELGADADRLVPVEQVEVEGRQVDVVDRIQVGAGIVRRLIDVGL